MKQMPMNIRTPGRLYATLATGSLLAALALPANAAVLNRVEADKSRLLFTVHEMGVPVAGSFRRFSTNLRFDAAHPERTRFSLEIDVASVDAGSDMANSEAAGRLWFDTSHFPKARFTARQVRATGAGRFEAVGTLSLKGHEHEMAVPFTIQPQAGGSVADGHLVIRRADYGIGEGEWADFSAVANEIDVNFHFAASAAP
jgi:polyisoprenoid-binding protein YceI